MPVLCARAFLGFFLSRSDQCGAGDQDNPVILTIFPAWLEVRVVLSPELDTKLRERRGASVMTLFLFGFRWPAPARGDFVRGGAWTLAGNDRSGAA